MKTSLRNLTAALALTLISLVAMPQAAAQFDTLPWSFGVYQNGLLVGELYRQDTDPSHYTEHWVLYPSYVYPNDRNDLVTTIRPGLTYYRDLAEFFAHVPFARGSRYVSTACSDGIALPVSR